MLKGILQKQIKLYGNAKDPMKKTKIAQNIGYLVQVQSNVIKEEKNIEERIQHIEGLLEHMIPMKNELLR